MIPVFSNTLGDEELAAVERVFASHWLGKGRENDAFEVEFAAHLGGKGHVLLTNCCTSAIYLALRVLDIGPGDEVIMPTVHFVAAASAILELGARPIFADVDAHTLNLLPEEVARLRTPCTRAVFLLHYGGHPADVDLIVETAGDALLIEDAANAPASRYHDRACGTLGVVGMWSFDAMKILVMGDGGALWLADAETAERARMLRYLGLRSTSGLDAQMAGRDRWWEYDLGVLSGRFINNDVQAAIGRVQLARLPGFVGRRRGIWEIYQHELAGVGDLVLPPEPLPGCTSSYYLYWLQTARRDELAAHLRNCGIYTTFRYYPLHMVKFYNSDAHLPNAEQAAQITLCLPLHQNLGESDQAYIINMIKDFFNGHS